MMTDEQLADWGRQEDVLRQAEMQAVSSARELHGVQAAVRVRRKAVGLSASQAVWWVTVGQRIGRGENLAFAMRER